MPGRVPGIFSGFRKKDRRDKPGDDETRAKIANSAYTSRLIALRIIHPHLLIGSCTPNSRHPGEGRDPALVQHMLMESGIPAFAGMTVLNKFLEYAPS